MPVFPVQHVSSTVNPAGIGIDGNAYKHPLPHNVLAGNCLVLFVDVAWAVGRTVSVSDNLNGAWPAAVDTVNDGGQIIGYCFIFPNTAGGALLPTITLNATAHPVGYVLMEWPGIATVAPFNGAAHSFVETASGVMHPGSFTPGNNNANGGNLILTHCFDNSAPGSANKVTAFVAGGAANLISADLTWDVSANPHSATQAEVQAVSAAINPSISATMSPSPDTYNVMSVALKLSPGAGQQRPAGMRIVGIHHRTLELIGTTVKIQVPTIGNCVLVTTSIGQDITDFTGCVDTNSNPYSLIEPVDITCPQFFLAGNATADTTKILTLSVSGASPGDSFAVLDIIGAANSPLGASAGHTGTSVNGLTAISGYPSLTPASADGLCIARCGLGQGPGLAVTSPAGAVFAFVQYTGEQDTDTMENADLMATLVNTSVAAQSWNWTITNQASNTAYATAVHLQPAPAGGGGSSSKERMNVALGIGL